MSGERLHKWIARAGLASRREAEVWIREGRVSVNGRLAQVGELADPAVDAILVDGKRLRPPAQPRYYLLNKPRGTVTTRSDPEGRPTVFDLVPAGQRRGLRTVGRLDYHSEGLLVLTDDGELAQRLTHPRHGCAKVYETKVKGRPSEAAVERLRRGISIDGRRTAPAGIRFLRTTRSGGENSWWEVELREGRTRQVREMFFRIGHPVQRLRRVAIGALRDPRLARGQLRPLRPSELALLEQAPKRRRKPRVPAGGRAAGSPGAGTAGRPRGAASGRASGRAASSRRKGGVARAAGRRPPAGGKGRKG